MLCADDFWHYSLSVYANEEVKSCCLNLQNDFQLNVNILLFCGYLKHRTRCLTQSQFIELRNSIGDLDLQTQLLRSKRNAAKSQAEDIYQRLLKQELTLEKKQQRYLIKSVNQMKIETCDKHNLIEYVLSVHQHIEPLLQQRLSTLESLLNNQK